MSRKKFWTPQVVTVTIIIAALVLGVGAVIALMVVPFGS